MAAIVGETAGALEPVHGDQLTIGELATKLQERIAVRTTRVK